MFHAICALTTGHTRPGYRPARHFQRHDKHGLGSYPNHHANGVQLTEPVEPGHGVQLTEPVEPGHGVQLTEPVEPVEPVEPGHGVQLTEPVEPVEPGHGVQLTEPVEPGHGVQLTEPVEPGHGVQLTEPVEPGHGVQLTEPVEPGHGVQLAQPVEPGHGEAAGITEPKDEREFPHEQATRRQLFVQVSSGCCGGNYTRRFGDHLQPGKEPAHRAAAADKCRDTRRFGDHLQPGKDPAHRGAAGDKCRDTRPFGDDSRWQRVQPLPANQPVGCAQPGAAQPGGPWEADTPGRRLLGQRGARRAAGGADCPAARCGDRRYADLTA